jgi:hypothetical protein
LYNHGVEETKPRAFLGSNLISVEPPPTSVNSVLSPVGISTSILGGILTLPLSGRLLN